MKIEEPETGKKTLKEKLEEQRKLDIEQEVQIEVEKERMKLKEEQILVEERVNERDSTILNLDQITPELEVVKP